MCMYAKSRPDIFKIKIKIAKKKAIVTINNNTNDDDILIIFRFLSCGRLICIFKKFLPYGAVHHTNCSVWCSLCTVLQFNVSLT